MVRVRGFWALMLIGIFATMSFSAGLTDSLKPGKADLNPQGRWHLVPKAFCLSVTPLVQPFMRLTRRIVRRLRQLRSI